MEPTNIQPHLPPQQPNLFQRIGKLFGHVWKTIKEIPQSLVSVIKRITASVIGIFSSKAPVAEPQPLKDKIVLPLPHSPEEKKKEGDDKAWDSTDLFETQNEQTGQGANTEKKPKDEGSERALSPEIKEQTSSENPLESLGAVVVESRGNIEAADLIQTVSSNAISNAISNVSPDVIFEMFQSAQELLEVTVFASQELPNMMKTKENQPEGIKKYLELIGQLNNQVALLSNEGLNRDESIRSIKLAIESKVSDLEKELSAQIALYYKIKENGGGGDCLFLSVQQQVLGSNAGPKYYRWLAADYIRDNWREFEVDLHDFTEQDVNEESVRLYHHALTHTNFWGGDIEIKALSEVLKTPIVVINRDNLIEGATWGRIVGAKYDKLERPPIILRYNGSSHYQSLIQD
jgi:OTU-like cysteine protease